MADYRQILVAVDFSTESRVVVNKALDIARRNNAGLSLIHVVEYESARIVEIGVPKREIVRIAGEQGADLIVIGSHGRHGLQLLLGSTANGVLHLAKCDVLAVRVGT